MNAIATLLIAFFVFAATLEQEAYAETKNSASTSTPKVEIFVTSWCPYCKNLESFLLSRRIPFTRYDIERDEKANDRFKALGGEGIPLILINSEIVLKGFDETSFLETLRRAKSHAPKVSIPLT